MKRMIYSLGASQTSRYWALRQVTSTLAAFTLLTGTANADPLPFVDGHYVTDLALCALTDDELYSEYTDGITGVSRYINGAALSDLYEGGCTVTSVAQEGNYVRFSADCAQEGEEFTRQDTYTRISPTSFEHEGTVFKHCPAPLVSHQSDNALEQANSSKSQILCRSEGLGDIVVSLNDHEEDGRLLNCVSGPFVADMAGCAPSGSYALASPTGAPVIIGYVSDPRDYRDHLGGVTYSGVSDDSLYFAGGFMGPSSGYKEAWNLRISRLTGAATLASEEGETTFRCKAATPIF